MAAFLLPYNVCIQKQKGLFMRILYFDTETAPTKGYFYQRYGVNISPVQVTQNGFLLCFQYAWNDGEVFTESLSHIKNPKPKHDAFLLRKLKSLFEKADVVVAHNAHRFDIGIVNARLAAHGMSPLAPVEVVDTLRVCKRFFKFEANSLDSVCQQLGLGRKFQSGGYETTINILEGTTEKCADAWDKLLEYGEQDIILLRDLHKRVKPFITNHPNANLHTSRTVPACHSCGSEKLRWKGYRRTHTMVYKRFVCKSCGAWGQERTNCVDKEKRQAIVRGC
jgi:DNA polymerase elongation subunit (family B)